MPIHKACPAWGFVADTHLIKLHSLQNKILCIIDKYPRSTRIRDMYMTFQTPYVYNYVIKLCRQQAQVIQYHEIYIFAMLNKAKPDTENTRGSNLAAVRHKNTIITLPRSQLFSHV
jgi:hypothetical protein